MTPLIRSSGRALDSASNAEKEAALLERRYSQWLRRENARQAAMQPDAGEAAKWRDLFPILITVDDAGVIRFARAVEAALGPEFARTVEEHRP
jgi:hypothetical protein